MAAQLSTKLTLDGTQHNEGLREATKELSKYKRQVGEADKKLKEYRRDSQSATGSIRTMASAFKSGNFQGMLIGASGAAESLGGMLGKLGGAFGIAVGAGAAFSDMLAHNDNLNDAFQSSIAQTKSAIDTFWNSLANNNLGNFISDMNAATKAAKELYDAQDALATTQSWDKMRMGELEHGYRTALLLSRDRNLTEKERLKYLNQAKNILLQQAKIMQVQLKQAARLANTSLNKVLAENGLSHLQNDTAMQKWYENNQELIRKRVADFERAEKKMREEHTYTTTAVNGMTAKQVVVEDKVYKQWEKATKALRQRIEHYRRYINMVESGTSAWVDAQNARQNELDMEYALTQKQFEVDMSESRIQSQITSALKAGNAERVKALRLQQALLKDLNPNSNAQQQTMKLQREEFEKNNPKAEEYIPTPFEAVLADKVKKALQEGAGYVTFGKGENGQEFKTDTGATMYFQPNQDVDVEAQARKQYETYVSWINKIQNDADVKLNFDTDKAQSQIDIINEHLMEIGYKPIEINLKANKALSTISKIGDAAGSTADLLSAMGQATGDEGLQAAGIVANAIANILLGYAQATAAAGGTLGPFGWIAFSIAGLAQVVSMVSQIHSLSGYAEGGVVKGSTTVGDTVFARLNAGEMVLNNRQQGHLFKMLDEGSYGGGPLVVTGNLKIRGKDTYIALRNLASEKSKLGKNIGIH